MGIRSKETDVVRGCLDWLALHRIMAWRSNNAGVFDPLRKVFRTFHGLKGVADILGIFPQTVELSGERVTFGNLLAVECKRPGEAPRPEQEQFLRDVRDRGGIALCGHSVAALDEQMRAFMV